MKQIITIAMLLVLSTSIFAQSTTFTKFYGEMGTGPVNSNGSMYDIGVQGLLKNDWVASLSFYGVDLTPKNLPSDYRPGVELLFFSDGIPTVRLNLLNLTGGKVFHTGRKTWITTEAGMSFISGETMSFYRQDQGWWLLDIPANYSTSTESHTTVGAMLRANFNWAFSPYVGLNVGSFGNINSIQSAMGGEIKLIVGWLNTKKQPAR